MTVLSHVKNTQSLHYLLRHTKEIYGIKFYCKNSITYIITSDDTYKLEYNSKEKKYYFISTSKHYFISERWFERGLFRIACKKTYEEINLTPSEEDWRKFFNDAYKYGAMINGLES